MVTRRQKEETVEALEEKFKRAQSVVLADFQGLSVADMNLLRSMARETGVEFRVVKNSLVLLATRRAGIEGLEAFLVGPTGVAFGYEDPVTPAKVISRFGRETRKELAFKGGYLEGRVLGAEEVKSLAALPTRTELLGQLAGTVQGPIAAFHRVLAGNLRGLVVALNRIAEQKTEAA